MITKKTVNTKISNLRKSLAGEEGDGAQGALTRTPAMYLKFKPTLINFDFIQMFIILLLSLHC